MGPTSLRSIVNEFRSHCELIPLYSGSQYADNRDGVPGQNATLAIPGAPAGFLAVQLSESEIVPEGVHTRVIRYTSRQQPPTIVEVPARRDVLLTAIGGDGENGKTGGDGQDGIDGVDGQPATREIDETVRFHFTQACLLELRIHLSVYSEELTRIQPGTAGGNGGE